MIANGALLSVVAVCVIRTNFARTGLNATKFDVLIGPLATGVLHRVPSSDVVIENARVVAGRGAVPRPAPWARPTPACGAAVGGTAGVGGAGDVVAGAPAAGAPAGAPVRPPAPGAAPRSEEHTSELQSL